MVLPGTGSRCQQWLSKTQWGQVMFYQGQVTGASSVSTVQSGGKTVQVIIYHKLWITFVWRSLTKLRNKNLEAFRTQSFNGTTFYCLSSNLISHWIIRNYYLGSWNWVFITFESYHLDHSFRVSTYCKQRPLQSLSVLCSCGGNHTPSLSSCFWDRWVLA